MIPELSLDEEKLVRNGKRIEALRSYRTRTSLSIEISFRIVHSYADGFRHGIGYWNETHPEQTI